MSKIVSVVAKHPDTLRGPDGRLVGPRAFDADLANPFWRRLYRWKDIVPPETTVVDSPASSTPVADSASATTTKSAVTVAAPAPAATTGAKA